jgi:hypothetical protein
MLMTHDPYLGDAHRRNAEANRRNLILLAEREASQARDYEGSKADLENRELRRQIACLKLEAVKTANVVQQARDRQSRTQAGVTENKEGLAQLSKQQDLAALAQERATQERQAAAVDRERLAEGNLKNRAELATVVLPSTSSITPPAPIATHLAQTTDDVCSF